MARGAGGMDKDSSHASILLCDATCGVARSDPATDGTTEDTAFPVFSHSLVAKICSTCVLEEGSHCNAVAATHQGSVVCRLAKGGKGFRRSVALKALIQVREDARLGPKLC